MTKLYGYKQEAELQALVGRCLNEAVEYDIFSWQQVKKEDLAKLDVQLRLVKTMYASQILYEGVESEILHSLENWADEDLVFPHLNKSDQDFYQKYYCFLGFMTFPYAGFKTQTLLLQSRLLALACLWGVPIYSSVQEYFALDNYLEHNKKDAEYFAYLIAHNFTLLGDKQKIIKPIYDWIKRFDGWFGSSLEKKIEEYMADDMEVKRLDAISHDILHKIVTLYWGLKGGFIYLEIDYNARPGQREAKTTESKSESDYYLAELKQMKVDDLVIWLETYQDFADWVYLSGQDAGFARQVLKIIKPKVDLTNEKQVDLLFKLLFALSEKGLTNVENAVYFDAKDQAMHWNEFILG